MTGGQPAEGGFTVAQIAHQVWAEGAKRVAIVSDDPGKYPRKALFPGRRRPSITAASWMQLQRELREIKGLTGPDLRPDLRRRKAPPPQARALSRSAQARLHQRPRLRGLRRLLAEPRTASRSSRSTPSSAASAQIDQSNCNKDYSCVEGFCPSFVTVHGGTLRSAQDCGASIAGSRSPTCRCPAARELDAPYNILVTGIGGTGVITIGALLGMAAHLDGRGCSALDFTGLAQKNGAVMSHVRIAPAPEDIATVRITSGGADLILGCDIVVSASADRALPRPTRRDHAPSSTPICSRPRASCIIPISISR